MLISQKVPPKSVAPIDRGLQRLAGAVLIQALQDAGSGPRRCRDESIEWIQGKTEGNFSFDFCCALLGRSTDDVRERLQKYHLIPRWDPTMDDATHYSFPANSSPFPGFIGGKEVDAADDKWGRLGRPA